MTAFDFARAPPAEARAAPTPLLAHLTGPHAAQLARVWPAPHLEFVALDAPRRHLAAIALAHVRAEDMAALRRVIERSSLRDALRFALRTPPRGLTRALALMGETLWATDDYELLLALLREPRANLVLRHAAAISPDLLAILAALPEALRVTGIVAKIASPALAVTLADAFAAARWINRRRPERDLVLAWSRTKDGEALARAATDALKPDRFGETPPAPDLLPPYRRLAGRAAVEAAALRFRNCIASYMWEVAADELALFVWEGEPAAVIAVKRDAGGWRFAEALAAENYPLPDRVLTAIAADMVRAGVRVGLPVRALEDRLEALGDGPPRAAVMTLAARLGLGQLWR